MTQNDFLNSTVADWILWYQHKRNICKGWLIAIVCIDVLTVAVYPSIYLAGYKFGIIRAGVILFVILFVLLLATIKIRINYLLFKSLVLSLESERDTYINNATPYEAADTRSSKLFLKNTKNIISNSVSALSYMPEGFADH